MRKILITLGIVVLCLVAILATWIFAGRQLTLFIDQFWTVEIASTPIDFIAYEGGGTGGILVVNDLRLSLNEASAGISPSFGSTKDNQFAVASGGNVFPFGPLTSTSENAAENLVTAPPLGDQAFLATRHSVLSWPTPFDINLMTGQSPAWKRYMYHEIRWTKSSGRKLQLLWRYQQFFYPGNGWASGFMTREGSTGLIRVEIKE
jgi:hypothetical protein